MPQSILTAGSMISFCTLQSVRRSSTSTRVTLLCPAVQSSNWPAAPAEPSGELDDEQAIERTVDKARTRAARICITFDATLLFASVKRGEMDNSVNENISSQAMQRRWLNAGK